MSGRTRPGRRWSRVCLVVGSVVTVVLLARSLSSYLPDVAAELRHPQLGWLAAAIAAELVSMVAFSELQRTVLRSDGTNVSARTMLGLTFEANAVSGSLPAGAAFAAGYRLRQYRSWGSSAPAAGFTLVVTGLVSTVAFGALAAVSAWVADGRSAGPGPAVLAAVLLATAAVGARLFRRHPAAARRMLVRGSSTLDRVRRRSSAPAESLVLSLIDATAAIRPTALGWSKALIYASLNWVADLGCLVAASRAVGIGDLHVEAIVVAYVAGMSVATVSLAPGGLGTVEAAMTFALSSAGSPHAAAIASVLLYRLVSYVLMVIIGWALWLARRRRRTVEAGSLRPEAASPELSAAAR